VFCVTFGQAARDQQGHAEKLTGAVSD
jgi:hypothetical protein